MNFFELLDSGINFAVEVYSKEEDEQRYRAYEEYKFKSGSRSILPRRGKMIDTRFIRGHYDGWNKHGDYRRHEKDIFENVEIYRWDEINPEVVNFEPVDLTGLL